MTAPVVHGYPDYGRFAGRADVVHITDTVLNANAQVDYPPIFIGGDTHLGISYDGSGDQSRLSINYVTASSGGISLSTNIMDFGDPGGIQRTVPINGPWAIISVTPMTAGPLDYNLRVWTAAGPFIAQTTGVGNIILAVNNQNVGAGATVNLDSIVTWPGEAHYYARSSAAVFSIATFSRDAALVNTLLHSQTNLRPELTTQLFLPATPIRAALTNNDAAARLFDYVLVGRPLMPGT